MKLFLFSVGILTLIFTFSCTHSGDHSHEHGDGDMTDVVDAINTIDTISEQKFNKWQKSWQKDGSAYMDTASLFQYFTLPAVDLREVLSEGAVTSKYFFGLEKLAKDAYTMKFMLVGVDKKGDDLIDYANGSYIYDLSKLCPPFCDPG